MDKRKFGKLEREQASQPLTQRMAIRGMLGKNSKFRKWAVQVTQLEKDLLVLHFYKHSREPLFRAFMSKEDYLLQDLTTDKIKWSTTSFEGHYGHDLVKCYYHDEPDERGFRGYTYMLNAFAIPEDEELLRKFYEEYLDKNHDSDNPWAAILLWQNDVMEKRLDERHRRETDVIDWIMEPIKDTPKDFEHWVMEEGLKDSRYLIYKKDKKETHCECTYCGQSGTIKTDSKMINNRKGICPFCGSPVTYKAKGRMPYQIQDNKYALYIDPTEDGFVARYFFAYRDIKSDKYPKKFFKGDRVEQGMYEMCRDFYSFGSCKTPITKSFEWAPYKQKGPSRWSPSLGNVDCSLCILYPNNLPEAWQHTSLKYSGLEYLSKANPAEKINYSRAMGVYLRFPKMEWICKMGLSNLAGDIIRNYNYGNVRGINRGGKTIYDILGLDKINTKLLQEVNGNGDVLRLLQEGQNKGIRFKKEELVEFYNIFGCATLLVRDIRTTFHKLIKYIKKESKGYPSSEYTKQYIREYVDAETERQRAVAHDWIDYIKWCKELGYDLNDMFYYLPKNFKAVHDRTYKEYQTLLDKRAKERQQELERLALERSKEVQKELEELFKSNEDTDAFNITGKNLILVIPKGREDLKREGESLHHCVATYAEQVAKGETNIFFIRKADNPETPYFTMEFRDNRIIQCRGDHNCGMPTEVEAFVKTFEKKMQKQSQTKERRCG